MCRSCHRAGADPHRRDCRIWLVLFRGETYMAAWNVSGLGTFGEFKVPLTLRCGRSSVWKVPPCRRCGEKPETQCPYRHHWWGLIAAVCYVLSTTAIMGMIPMPHCAFLLRHSVMPHGWRWVHRRGHCFLLRSCGLLRFTGRWTLLAGQTAKAAADDGLFPRFLPV